MFPQNLLLIFANKTKIQDPFQTPKFCSKYVQSITEYMCESTACQSTHKCPITLWAVQISVYILRYSCKEFVTNGVKGSIFLPQAKKKKKNIVKDKQKNCD